MVNNLEIEFKYRANNVKLEDFQALMDSLTYTKRLEVSSLDIYYTNPSIPEKFVRYRAGNTPELTKKVKTEEGNSWKRIEVDLPLDKEKVNESIVSSFVGMDGYQENFRIFKTCFIYWNEIANFVYYTVYDRNMHEQGRFIEVELNKETLHLVEDPEKTIREYEKYLTDLGITPQNRLKKSLFELYMR